MIVKGHKEVKYSYNNDETGFVLRGYERLRTFYIGAEVVADLPQDEVDVVLPRDRVCRHLGGCVGRPGDGHLLPGQEEDDAAVARRRVEKAHVVGAVRSESSVVMSDLFLNKHEDEEEEKWKEMEKTQMWGRKRRWGGGKIAEEEN